MEFLFLNFELVVSLIVVLVMLIFGLIARQWSLVRISAYQLMLAAQKIFATDEGKQKFEMVYSKLWILLPAWFKKAIGREKLREKLQAWYDIAKDMLSDEPEKL